MGLQEIRSNLKTKKQNYPVMAAQKFIRLFSDVRPNEEQQAMLAAAYYVLATEQNMSINRSKMHVNAAITLLKNINQSHRKTNWSSQIAHAYFKRAELQEEKSAFNSASDDYKNAIQILEEDQRQITQDKDHLLLARSSLSIADLMVHEQVELNGSKPSHPLFYVNKALEYLGKIDDLNDEIWTTYAYAHQIAGICLSTDHFNEACDAFQAALLMVFKTQTIKISPLLADIYTCLGLQYEQQYHQSPIEKRSDSLLDHAMIYFGLSLLFSYSDSEEIESDTLVLESLFEIIYRVLDPFLVPISATTTSQLVDALIYTYSCIVDNSLPNQVLAKQLCHPETLDTVAQHIYWLVMEVERKRNPRIGFNGITEIDHSKRQLEIEDILKILETETKDNICYFPRSRVEETTEIT